MGECHISGITFFQIGLSVDDRKRLVFSSFLVESEDFFAVQGNQQFRGRQRGYRGHFVSIGGRIMFKLSGERIVLVYASAVGADP